MKHHLITFGFLALALVSYFLGFEIGIWLFVIIGIVSELVFRVRLFRLPEKIGVRN